MDQSDRKLCKCVIWDLDNTLWEGTLLEGDTLRVRPEIRRIVEALDRRGVLQSVASKNDQPVAWAKLEELGLAHYFLCPQIGWCEKADSIRTVAETLGLSLQTIVFVDDEPYERDQVTYFLPAVRTLAATDVSQLLEAYDTTSGGLSSEGVNRRQMYQADLERRRLEESLSGGKGEFLRALQMQIRIRRATRDDLTRAEELTLRTSQLNTTGRVYQVEELARLLHHPQFRLLVLGLTDRYGDSGTVGLALIEQRAGTWTIRLFITSCRVLTRGVAGILMSHILQTASQAGVCLQAEFVPTPRNRVMYVTYKFHGFYEIAAAPELILLQHDLRRISPAPSYVALEWEAWTWTSL